MEGGLTFLPHAWVGSAGTVVSGAAGCTNTGAANTTAVDDIEAPVDPADVTEAPTGSLADDW